MQIKEYPQEIQKLIAEVFNNPKTIRYHRDNSPYDDMQVGNLFDWSRTPQGHTFWSSIQREDYDEAKATGFYPPLVDPDLVINNFQIF